MWKRAHSDTVEIWSVDDLERFDRVFICYDSSRSRDWPRQRSHFAMTASVDGWRTVFELHDLAPYDPRNDEVGELVVISVSIEPDGGMPLVLRQMMRAEKAKKRNDGQDPKHDQAQLSMGRRKGAALVGERPTTAVPAKGLTKPSVGAKDAAKIVTALVNGEERKTELAHWYRMPWPVQSKPRPGRGGRGRRDYAELTTLYLTALEESPDACLLYTSPSPRDKRQSRMPSSA